MEPVPRLRRIFLANAGLSAASGLVCLALVGPLTDVLGPDRPGVVRVVGATLVLFAADLALFARAGTRWLLPGARVVAGLDAGWTVAMVVLALSGVLEPAGIALVLVTGVATAELAVLEWTGAGRAERSFARRAPSEEALA